MEYSLCAKEGPILGQKFESAEQQHT